MQGQVGMWSLHIQLVCVSIRREVSRDRYYQRGIFIKQQKEPK